LLGSGQFGMVYSVESLKSQAKAEQAQSNFNMPNKAEPQPETADMIQFSDEFKQKMNMLHEKRSEISCLYDSLSTFDRETDTAPESTTFSFSRHNEGDIGEGEDREEAHRKQEYMATDLHCRGKSRYVIKRLRNNFEDPHVMFAAAADIASEALILANLKHTSIVTIRATVGTPGKSDFGIILDRLQCTLKQKIKDWTKAKKVLKGGILQRLVRPLGCLEDSHRLEVMHSDRLLAVYDIARALQYLHDRR
jgi:serine/threonine protein kinase